MIRIIIAMALISFFSFAQEPAEEEVEVVVGIDKVIKYDFSFSTKIQIGNEALIQLTLAPQEKEITYKGIKPGQTSVIIRDNLGEIKKRYIINVTATGLSKTVADLRELIGNAEGLEIGIKGGKVFVGGEIVVPDDIGRVSAILAGYPDILNIVELSPQTRRVVGKRMQDEINKNGMKEVTVRIVNKAYWLEGVVDSDEQKKLAMTISEAYLPDDIESLSKGADRVKSAQNRPVIYDFISVNQKKKPSPPPKQVKISSQFVELSKDYSKVFAFKWMPLVSDGGSSITFGKTVTGGVSSQSSGALSATINNLFPKLSSAKNAGYARIIQSGMVVTKDQMKASVSKQTEVPFAVGTGEFSKATATKVGFTMGVTPKILEQEKVEISINMSVNIASGTNAQGNPIASQNLIDTNIVVKSKQSAAIGGIVQSNAITGYDKNDPGQAGSAATSSSGGASSVTGGSSLFMFLRSKSLVTNKNQYVMFVTPEIIESASLGTEEIRKKFRKRSR